MNLTVDPNTRKVLINDIEVIDPEIIGQSILDDLKPKQINKESIIQKLKDYCYRNKNKHGHCIPVTEERLVLLDIITSYNGLFSAKDLLNKTPRNFSIARATVYSTLLFFEKAEIIKQINLKLKGKEARKYYTIKN